MLWPGRITRSFQDAASSAHRQWSVRHQQPDVRRHDGDLQRLRRTSGATTAVALRNATLSGAVGGQNTFVNGGTVVDLGNTAAFTGALLNNSVVQNVRGYRSINAGGIIGSQMFYGSSSGSLSLQVAAAAGTSIIWQFPATNGTTGDVYHTRMAPVS